MGHHSMWFETLSFGASISFYFDGIFVLNILRKYKIKIKINVAFVLNPIFLTCWGGFHSHFTLTPHLSTIRNAAPCYTIRVLIRTPPQQILENSVNHYISSNGHKHTPTTHSRKSLLFSWIVTFFNVFYINKWINGIWCHFYYCVHNNLIFVLTPVEKWWMAEWIERERERVWNCEIFIKWQRRKNLSLSSTNFLSDKMCHAKDLDFLLLSFRRF